LQEKGIDFLVKDMLRIHYDSQRFGQEYCNQLGQPRDVVFFLSRIPESIHKHFNLIPLSQIVILELGTVEDGDTWHKCSQLTRMKEAIRRIVTLFDDKQTKAYPIAEFSMRNVNSEE